MNLEIITIIGTGAGVIGFLYTVIRNFRKDMHDMFDKSETRWIEATRRIDETNRRIDDSYRKIDESNRDILRKIDESNRRMDGVYHILLKRIKEE